MKPASGIEKLKSIVAFRAGGCSSNESKKKKKKIDSRRHFKKASIATSWNEFKSRQVVVSMIPEKSVDNLLVVQWTS
jgi:hypothetical protein